MSPSQVIKPDPRTPPHGNSSRKRPRDSPDSLDQSSAHDTKKRMIRHPTAPPPCLPEAKLTFGRFPVSRSIEYNRDLDHLDITGPLGFHHVRRPRTSAPDRSSIIVAIAGACPNNGTGDAQRSSCGVYFGDSCRETRGFRVDSGPAHPHTNQRAELHAAIAALDTVKPFCEKGDIGSSYIVEAVGGGKRGQSPYMEMWMANGFRTAQGLSIKNLDLWRDVLQRLRDVQNLGSFVEFWLVSKAENQEARELAAAGQSRRAAAEEMMASFRNAYGPFPTVKKEPK
ncbi:hypothetical protein COL940_003714 [Colletotrichum noveboracense]|nr:hypothetical protein COL940_003714 [Colletotrichum noveboracense]